MASPRCGEVHPEKPEVRCLNIATPHADHWIPGLIWPNGPVQEEMRQRQAAKKNSSKSRRARQSGLVAIASAIVQAKREGGIPGAAVAKWTKETWPGYAERVFIDFLRTRTEPFTTAEDVWPLIEAPEEMRAMSVVTQRLIRSGLMKEVGARRLKGTYASLDGVEFQENKLVPVYEPTSHRST